MDDQQVRKAIRIDIGHDMSGQLAVGDNNVQLRGSDLQPPVTETELAELRQAFADLQLAVERSVDPKQKEAAQERVTELEQAVMADKPDLTTMQYVKRWLMHNVPSIAGAVTSIFVNPIVGKLVAAGGDALVAEFNRTLGTSPNA